MATEADKLKVGAFLLGGLLVFCAALVWIGASHVLERRLRYVSYFDESVHGLNVGSAVKFRGVPIGRVAAIGIAPDGRLVEVGMDIEQDFRAGEQVRASVTTSGLTGVSVIDIDFARPGAAPLKLAFAPPERYIPSQPSFLSGLTEALGSIAESLRGTDVGGLVAEFRAAAAAVRQRFEAPEVDRALAKVAAAADSLEVLTRRAAALVEDPRLSRALDGVVGAAERVGGAARAVEAVAGDPRVAQTLEDARAAAAVLRRGAEDIRAEVAAVHAGARLDSMQRKIEDAMAGVSGAAQSAAASVGDTGAAATRTAERWERLATDLNRSLGEAVSRLDRAAGRLESLATSIEANPAKLLGKPPKEDFR
ncbi:MAG TPA: MlaD family protein [bacterium]